ncbi:MAG: hypothetical protein ACXIUD_01685 [Mongoliitalea sp.]
MIQKHVPIAYHAVFILLGITLVVKFMGWIDIPSIINAILIVLASVLFFWNAMLTRKARESKTEK